ncbi:MULTISPECIES: hypothetical protein [unclassified Pseudomonas]|uniref:hypothetical protein n=1 Tax=Pseudomonas TaxID=286 RepID=UPI001F5A4B84|nr:MULTISPECIES: hypothetical protein [unclassified Pseudomonas]
MNEIVIGATWQENGNITFPDSYSEVFSLSKPAKLSGRGCIGEVPQHDWSV